MKTYRSPPSSSLSTSAMIEHVGESYLCSALNFNRIIAFTGSGSTMEYGRPSWTDLVEKFIELAQKNKEQLEQDYSNSISPSLDCLVSNQRLNEIWQEFERLFVTPNLSDVEETSEKSGKKMPLNYNQIPSVLTRNPDFTASFLTMCEQIASWSESNDERDKQQRKLDFRKKVADEFAKSELPLFYDATIKSFGGDSDSQSQPDPAQVLDDVFEKHFIRHSDDVSGVSRINSKATIAILGLSLAYIHKSREERKPPSQTNFTLVDEDADWARTNQLYNSLISCISDQEKIDPLSIIYQELGVKRFLTLNYDIEIERMLATHLANSLDNSHKNFCEFLKNPVTHRPIAQERELKNGLQRALRTSSISQNNLGDLFNFGAFSNAFDTSVFHLHGRVDDPENMIITQLDYERLYLQSSNQRRSFEEARHTVFNGADILFIGSGMRETDILAPLRDFTANHRKLDDAPSRLYALIVSSTHKDNWRAENTGQAHYLFKHYGVYTLFLDGEVHCYHQHRNHADRSQRCKICQDKSEQNKAFRTARQWFQSLQSTFDQDTIDAKKLISLLHKLDEENRYSIISELPECKLVSTAIRSVSDENTTDHDELNLYAPLLKRLIIEAGKRLTSRILQEKLKELSHRKTEWWKDWQELPKHRLAVYGEVENTTSSPLVWVRHKVDYHYDYTSDSFGKPEIHLYSDYLKQFREHAAKLDDSPLRILRITAAKGLGKGGIVKLLSERVQTNDGRAERYYFEQIFPTSQRYVGGFFAHLTFTLEFTSTVYALVRFIIKAASLSTEDTGFDVHILNHSESEQPSGLWLLEKTLAALTCQSKRIFICLSGLYRLVDECGDAYSPVHRAFFRLITAYGSTYKPSIDLVLVARTQPSPIRYLSDEVPKNAQTEQEPKYADVNRFVQRDHYLLEKWPILEPADPQQTIRSAFFAAKSSLSQLFDIDEKAFDGTIDRFESSNSTDSHIYSLKQFIQRRVINTHLFVTLLCWRRVIDATSHTHIQTNDIDYLVNSINASISSEGAGGFFKRVMKEYRQLDLASEGEIKRIIAPVNVSDVILRHLALFNHPVELTVLLECPDLALRLTQRTDLEVAPQDTTDKNYHLLVRAMNQLVAKKLVIRIQQRARSSGDRTELYTRYSLHQSISQVISDDMNYITEYTSSSAPYQTTLYCAQTQSRRGVPSPDHYYFVTRLLKHFITVIDYSMNNLEDSKTLTFSQRSALIRGSYAILRGSFSIGAISRMEMMGEMSFKQPYETYRLWIQSIMHLTIRLSQLQDKKVQIQSSDEAKEKIQLEHNLPLYKEEISWLYNEQGVVSFMQGKVFDAISLYHQALTVAKKQVKHSEEQAVYAPIRRIQVNLALAEIERGNIHKAINILDKVLGGIVLQPSSTISLTALYATGYRALCDHLTGNLSQAEAGYKKVINEVQKRRQLRTLSIFQRHLADLYRVQGLMEDANQLLLLSEKAASQAQQEDILNYTLISRARLMRDLASRVDALRILRRAENYAKTMGLQKMLAEALKVRAEVMLAEGEVTQAGKTAAQAVAIFNRNGLRLRKLSAALLQARVYLKRSQTSFAHKILIEVEQEASDLGYTLKSSSAQEERQNLNT